jgi:hypothetical protein
MSRADKLECETAMPEKCKKSVVPSLHLMKPSLSLTSLPPQSPKEPTNDGANERPYNSLKVKDILYQHFLNLNENIFYF